MTLLTGSEFDALFDSYAHDAWRLEVRDSYLGVAYEPEPFRRFMAGETDDGEWLRDWTDGVSRRASEGKTMARVRVVTVPLSDYARFSLDVCQRHNIPAGEDIRYLPRDAARGLPDHDFWLFDSSSLYVIHFDDTNDMIGAEPVDDPAEIARHIAWRDLAWSRALKPAQFAATTL
jgi:hypothetical protein